MTLALLPPNVEMYGALLRRDSSYEGLFVVAVKTTGIFCRPTCPARKPKPENVEYFPGVRDALLAGYRACLRCRPMEPAGAAPTWLQTLLAELEADPELRVRDEGLRARGLEPARVRRWFQTHHGMTFHAYQRARRLGHALAQIRQGADLTDSGFGAGYESTSGFRGAFAKLFGDAPGRSRSTTSVLVNRILTPLGAMIAAATEQHLLLLEFADRRMLETQIKRLRSLLGAVFVPGDNPVLAQTQREVAEYFAGERTDFEVPITLPGTEFQRAVWAGLQTIPYGETRSYGQQAEIIGRPAAVRAVGRANGDNRLAIIVPCHRVVGADGALTGYGGQLWRKRALLELEGCGASSSPE